MVENRDNIGNDRTGGTSDASANPPVVLSLEQIIDKLAADGVDCEPNDFSLLTLKLVGYHRLKAYIGAIRAHNEQQACSVKQAYDLIELDRSVSTIILKYIGVLEIEVKARYVQLMAETYGAFAWYDKDLFLRGDLYDKTITNIRSEVNHQVAKGNRRFKRLLDRNDGRIPLWEIAEYASFGAISKLYANTADTTVTNEVAAFFNVGKDRLVSWLRTLNDVRNICAHFQPYIIRRQIPSIPKRDASILASHKSPLYVIPMLAVLLERKDTNGTEVAAQGVNYTKSIIDEYAALIATFKDRCPYILDPVNFCLHG